MPALKAKVALASLKGEESELTRQFDAIPTKSRNGRASFWREM